MEDGMKAMERVGSNIKDRIVVRYVNEFGEEEAGIDAGGLFKDFLTDLSKRIFDPSYVSYKLTVHVYMCICAYFLSHFYAAAVAVVVVAAAVVVAVGVGDAVAIVVAAVVAVTSLSLYI